MEKAAYLKRETILTIVISAILSALACWLVFGWGAPMTIWGIGAYAFDTVVQSFAIGLLAALVPGLLCRKLMQAGKILGVSASPPKLGAVFGGALLSAILFAIIGGGLCALLLWLSGWQTIGHQLGFAIKVIYGMILGALVTHRFLVKLTG